ncbi:MAG TPA: glycosyltransferase family 4 protein [Actinobacteria bacterium]|nr:glycosyltransferase family 4 protein [Actinomycetes bacterium]HEX21771.1 glycosyltransferase family 4 protein [Actinomycetota bacterium]
MKIGMIAPIWYPIPPTGYGGIEMIVSLLTEGLINKGHEVTLFAAAESVTKAKLVSSFKTAPSAQIGEVYPDLINAMTAYTYNGDFDIIHDHSGIIGPAIGAFYERPVLHTLHGPATPEAKRFYGLLGNRVYLNAISEYQRESFGNVNIIDTVYNAIDLSKYSFSDEKDDYLLFLGRMNPEKGAHLAVEIANKLGKRLILVAKMVEPAEKRYFKEQVEPLIKDNTEVWGEIDSRTKAELFRNAKCTLFPIQWPEPFGLVMIESLAAGTPVVAMRNGAVPEVVVDGETGFIVDDIDQMIEAVKKVDEIVPKTCRAYVEDHFSTTTMVNHYEATYELVQSLAEKKLAMRAVS